MKTAKTLQALKTRNEIIERIDAIQVWFASRPYGFREHATPQQLQQWDDREREQDYLVARLEALNESL